MSVPARGTRVKLWLPALPPLRARRRSGNVAGHSAARRLQAGASTCQKTT